MNNELKRLNLTVKQYAEFGSPKYFIANNDEMVYTISAFSDQVKAVRLLNESFEKIKEEDGKLHPGYIESISENTGGECVIRLNFHGEKRMRELYTKTGNDTLLFSELDKDVMGLDYLNKRLVFKNNNTCKKHPSLLEQNCIGTADLFGEGVSDTCFTGRLEDVSNDYDIPLMDTFEFIFYNHS
ncbi:MAG: hypothetical protein ACP5NV_01655 [Candidatus Woesearchaeota archaeon]